MSMGNEEEGGAVPSWAFERLREEADLLKKLGADPEGLRTALEAVIVGEPRDEASDNLNPAEAKTPLRINGIKAARFIKRAYGLGSDLNGPGRFDLSDPVQEELRNIKGWIQMAERDALDARE